MVQGQMSEKSFLKVITGGIKDKMEHTLSKRCHIRKHVIALEDRTDTSQMLKLMRKFENKNVL